MCGRQICRQLEINAGELRGTHFEQSFVVSQVCRGDLRE